jgi:hypothetical protein
MLLFVIGDTIKWTLSRDFRPTVFSANNTPGPPDSRAEAVLNMDRTYCQLAKIPVSDYKNRLDAIRRIVRSRYLDLGNSFMTLFYWHNVPVTVTKIT